MHSIKNILERNKIDTQSRAPKNPKNPLGWFFLNPGFFQPCLSRIPDGQCCGTVTIYYGSGSGSDF